MLEDPKTKKIFDDIPLSGITCTAPEETIRETIRESCKGGVLFGLIECSVWKSVLSLFLLCTPTIE